MTTVVAGIVQNALFGSRNCLLGANVLAPDQNNQVRLLVSAGQTANLIQGARHCGNSVFEKIKKISEKVSKVYFQFIFLCYNVSIKDIA